jgi:hypothetical protein
MTGIGSGGNETTVQEIEIVNGHFLVQGISGSGIGSGNGNSTVSRIVVYNGTFDLRSRDGSAIGAGWDESSRVGNLTIVDGTFRTKGFTGIGSIPEQPGQVNVLRMTGIIDLDCQASGSACIGGKEVIILNNSIDGFTTTGRLFSGTLSPASSVTGVNWIIRYLSETSKELIVGIPLFHSGPITASSLVFTHQNGDEVKPKSVVIGNTAIHGLLVSVSDPGIYEVESYSAEGILRGYLVPQGSSVTFVWIGNGDTFYSSVGIVGVGFDLTSSEITLLVIGGSAVVVLLFFGGLAIWRKAIRVAYAFQWRKNLAASGIESYT